MLPRADLTGANPISAVEAPRPTASVADVRQESFERLNRLDIGKHYQAEILSRLTDGTFMVKIADVAVRMNLPAGVEAGESLDLQLIAMQPRLTFLLGRPADTAAAATLSSTGKLIGNLLQSAQKDGAPTALVSSTPVMTLASDGPPQIASALKDSLSFSGLFYESHLSQWVQGSRPLSDLMREPQAAAMAAVEGPQKDPEQATDPARNESMEAKATSMTAGHDMDAESARMISLQLQTLEQQRVQWQGELWPGQPLEWEVKREARDPRAEPERQSWQSVVRFELPNLGVVSAAIQLNGDRVQVHVRAAVESTTASLAEHRAEFAAALDAAGTRLDLLTVKQDPSA
ncbi:MAG: hypothetical protein JWR25_183 [Noviherbaspirillum sp.]|nr:hypothetical protein [Noviherbaspirillum sp.]